MKILIVDDSRAMRMIVMRALKSTQSYSGATVVQAADGKEALGVIAEEHPDVVLSDWNMPEMTGLELLKALNTAGTDVKFGFVTSESTPEMYDLAVGNGALFLVSKPFTPDALERALSKAL